MQGWLEEVLSGFGQLDEDGPGSSVVGDDSHQVTLDLLMRCHHMVAKADLERFVRDARPFVMWPVLFLMVPTTVVGVATPRTHFMCRFSTPTALSLNDGLCRVLAVFVSTTVIAHRNMHET